MLPPGGASIILHLYSFWGVMRLSCLIRGSISCSCRLQADTVALLLISDLHCVFRPTCSI